MERKSTNANQSWNSPRILFISRASDRLFLFKYTIFKIFKFIQSQNNQFMLFLGNLSQPSSI